MKYALVLLVVAGTVMAQGVHPVSGRRYAGVMGMGGAPWLTRAERVAEEQPDKAVDALKLKPGMNVADIGAGVGYISLKMARKIGQGKVYAVDIQPGMLEKLRENAAREKLTNIVPVLGAPADPKLPEGQIDVAIMVDVYHELDQPQLMLQNIRKALRPETGRLVLLEYRAEDPSVPIRPEHKMTVAQVRQEMEAEGFAIADLIETLPWQHIIVLKVVDSMKRVQ